MNEKKDEVTAAEVETKTEEPAAVEALPVQVEESSKQVHLQNKLTVLI